MFTKEEIELGIQLDPYAEPIFGRDQSFVSVPLVFATVNLELSSTNTLVSIADRIRAEKGQKPFYPVPGFESVECDEDGWYNFYVCLNDYAETKLSSCIEFVVVSEDADDNENSYAIELDEEDQRMIFQHLDEQCQTYFDMSCEELLNESRAELHGDMMETLTL